jgi:hypothetical protein
MKSPVKMKVAFSFVLFLACAWGCSALAEESAKYMEPAPSEEAKALVYIKTLPTAQLLEKGDLGRTRFFWAVCNGTNQIRDYILSKVDGEILADDPENQKLFGCCNFNSWCPADNIKGIGSLGFRPSTEDLLVSLANTTQCSTPKFDATFALNPPLDTKIGGGNILHQIVAKSAQGRPVLDRACLVHAIDQISKKAPQLLSEKNIDARTPLEAALYLKTHPKQWGSSIQAKDFNPLIEELQQTLSTAKK